MDDLKNGLNGLIHKCLVSAENHYASEGAWISLKYTLGVPSALLAAIAGAAGLTELFQPLDGKIIAGVLASCAAVFTAASTFLDPNQRALAHTTAAKAFHALYEKAGTWQVEFATVPSSPADALTKYAALMEAYTQLVKSSPPIPGRAYRKAQANLDDGVGEVVRLQPKELKSQEKPPLIM